MAAAQNKYGFIPAHGGFRNLISYQKAEIIYDGTVYFCNHFLTSMIVLLDRWCRQRGLVNKI